MTLNREEDGFPILNLGSHPPKPEYATGSVLHDLETFCRYGSSGAPPKIPGDSVLIFEVELVKIDRKDEF